ncbi:MAG: hypothetical protein IJT94_15535 [Oscillibacter sp.]|nr:hypothetical protein [Oscillibacter sp.]
MGDTRSYQMGKLVGALIFQHHQMTERTADISLPGEGPFNLEEFQAGMRAGYAEAEEKEASHGGQHQET